MDLQLNFFFSLFGFYLFFSIFKNLDETQIPVHRMEEAVIFKNIFSMNTQEIMNICHSYVLVLSHYISSAGALWPRKKE